MERYQHTLGESHGRRVRVCLCLCPLSLFLSHTHWSYICAMSWFQYVSTCMYVSPQLVHQTRRDRAEWQSNHLANREAMKEREFHRKRSRGRRPTTAHSSTSAASPSSPFYRRPQSQSGKSKAALVSARPGALNKLQIMSFVSVVKTAKLQGYVHVCI